MRGLQQHCFGIGIVILAVVVAVQQFVEQQCYESACLLTRPEVLSQYDLRIFACLVFLILISF
jgi:hypothetical protein